MKVPFATSRKLVNVPLGKQPSYIRNLLKLTPHQSSNNANNGPRTLESILSYISSSKEKRKQKRKESFKHDLRMSWANSQLNNIANTLHTNINANTDNNIHRIQVIVCLSVRDFPLGLHQRMIPWLASSPIPQECVHWVITDLDLLDIYDFPSQSLRPSGGEDSQSLKSFFVKQLQTYIEYARGKISPLAPSFEKIINWNIKESNVYLFSQNSPSSLKKLMMKFDYDMLESTETYVIGQANVGKTTLVREMLKLLTSELKDENSAQFDISSWRKCTPDSKPFASTFTVYGVPGMNIIDSPSFVRNDGGIWSHVNEYGANLLKIPQRKTDVKFWETLKRLKTVHVTPSFYYEIPKKKVFKGNAISIGDILFCKPWMIIPQNTSDETLQKFKSALKVSIKKNFTSHVQVDTLQDVERKTIQHENKVISQNQLQWLKYAINGPNFELVIDNIGTINFHTTIEGFDELPFCLCWEITLPQRVRFLQREYDNTGLVKLQSHRPVTASFTQHLSSA